MATAVAVAAAIGFGIVYSFGAFFREMADDLHAGRGATALVFGITVFLFFGLGALSGPLADRAGPRRLVVAGAVCTATGLFLTSRVQQIWLGYLTYGFGVGVGGGLYVTPCFAAVGGWFVRSRPMALGLASAGSGLGTLLLVPAANRLIDAYGWRTAYVVLGVVALVGLLATSFVIDRPPLPPLPPGDDHRAHVVRTRPFRLLFASGLLMSVALFFAFAFVVPFAEDEGISSTAAAVLVAVIGAASVTGRLLLSGLTRRLGPLRLYQGCIAVQPLAYVVWMGAGSRYGLLVVFAVLLGVSYGGYVALGPTVAADLFGAAGLGSVFGLLFLGAGLGGLIGPPLAGWLADSSGGQILPIAVSLAFTLVAVAVTLAIRPEEASEAAAAPRSASPPGRRSRSSTTS